MILAAVWSMSALSALAILSAHFETDVTFFPSLRFGWGGKYHGRIEGFAVTKTTSRENTDAMSTGHTSQSWCLPGSACNKKIGLIDHGSKSF